MQCRKVCSRITQVMCVMQPSLLFILCVLIICSMRSQEILSWKSELGRTSLNLSKPPLYLAGVPFKQLEVLSRPEAILRFFSSPPVKCKDHVFVQKTWCVFITIETKQDIRTGNLYGISCHTFALLGVRLLEIYNCNSCLKNPLVLLQALNWFFRWSLPGQFWFVLR